MAGEKDLQEKAKSEEIIEKLMRAEGKMRQMRASVITRTADAYRTATTGELDRDTLFTQ